MGLVVDISKEIREAEQRIETRLMELDEAERDGRLWDVIKDVPSIREQLGR